MRDGVELCLNVYLPFAASKEGQKVPVIASLGPYGKDIHSLDFVSPIGPDACFELADPLIWTHKHGYAIVRADTRGTGGSGGRFDPFGLERSLEINGDAEGQDVHDLVEWAGTQSWSSGKVALSGISYYGMVCWWGAMQRPKHLSAVVAYEGLCDIFNLASRMGGIGNPPFQTHWFDNVTNQRGRLEGVADSELKQNRADFIKLFYEYEWQTGGVWSILERERKLENIEVPVYSAGNWTDPEIHLPGNILAFYGASSKNKWLEMHTGNHLAAYYNADQIEIQRKFLDYFLRDQHDSGILDVPQINLQLSKGDNKQFYRAEQSFPPKDVEWESLYITGPGSLGKEKPAEDSFQIDYEGFTGRVQLLSEAFSDEFEILGCPYLELFVKTEAEDMDIFCYLRSQKADGSLVIFTGNHNEPINNFTRSWVRLSHRESAEDLLSQQIPIIRNKQKTEIVKGQVYKVILPIVPASYIFEPGYRLNVEIGACGTEDTLPIMRHQGGDRTPERFTGKNSILPGSRVVLPRVRRT
ncbi:hypothetical protein NLU13_6643 [Sarocladium strictum]|uniref:Xaa-Pro dipeptidyl-peptidase C-terminal domain-containing protein n=1 Tax=Sarocladium strictum TaxID=5046 RepID=A0AA39L7C2_SARSR|nr:hypothetical protein NLU13_6643 [Sarocladium strictum]